VPAKLAASPEELSCVELSNTTQFSLFLLLNHCKARCVSVILLLFEASGCEKELYIHWSKLA
jgi:hypothetical protein